MAYERSATLKPGLLFLKKKNPFARGERWEPSRKAILLLLLLHHSPPPPWSYSFLLLFVCLVLLLCFFFSVSFLFFSSLSPSFFSLSLSFSFLCPLDCPSVLLLCLSFIFLCPSPVSNYFPSSYSSSPFLQVSQGGALSKGVWRCRFGIVAETPFDSAPTPPKLSTESNTTRENSNN